MSRGSSPPQSPRRLPSVPTRTSHSTAPTGVPSCRRPVTARTFSDQRPLTPGDSIPHRDHSSHTARTRRTSLPRHTTSRLRGRPRPPEHRVFRTTPRRVSPARPFRPAATRLPLLPRTDRLRDSPARAGRTDPRGPLTRPAAPRRLRASRVDRPRRFPAPRLRPAASTRCARAPHRTEHPRGDSSHHSSRPLPDSRACTPGLPAAHTRARAPTTLRPWDIRDRPCRPVPFLRE